MIRSDDLERAWALAIAGAGAASGLLVAIVGLAPFAGLGMLGGAARVARGVQRDQPLPSGWRIASSVGFGAVVGAIVGGLLGELDWVHARPGLLMALVIVGAYFGDYLMDGLEVVASRWRRDPLKTIGEVRRGALGGRSNGAADRE